MKNLLPVVTLIIGAALGWFFKPSNSTKESASKTNLHPLAKKLDSLMNTDAYGGIYNPKDAGPRFHQPVEKADSLVNNFRNGNSPIKNYGNYCVTYRVDSILSYLIDTFPNLIKGVNINPTQTWQLGFYPIVNTINRKNTVGFVVTPTIVPKNGYVGGFDYFDVSNATGVGRKMYSKTMVSYDFGNRHP